MIAPPSSSSTAPTTSSKPSPSTRPGGLATKRYYWESPTARYTKYRTLLADPPWFFRNQRTRAATSNHYRTLRLQELLALRVGGRPISELTDERGAHCYLWVTAAHMPAGLSLMRHWGFSYVQNLVWVKTKGPNADLSPRLQIGLGNWFRHSHELCLFGTRGYTEAGSHALPTVLFAPRTTHSTKPVELYRLAEEMSPGPRIELFARNARAGWRAWGNQAPQS